MRLGIEVGVVEHGARGDHAGDGAAHESLRVAGILGLIADGDAVALVNELGGEGPVCALGTLYFSGDVRQAFARLTAE